MKLFLSSFIFLITFNQVQAQKIRTIVPTQPVVAGNAFQVQYIITDPGNLIEIKQPAFDSLQMISGPNHYKGTSLIDGEMKPIENITYTLIANRVGSQMIRGISASFKNSPEEKSEDVWITIQPQPRASFSSKSSYTDVNLYAPASKTDIDKLISENLFIKTEVSKKTVYVGEPLVVSFKLYSRLQSTSEVINAPSLYGFTVMDMLDINEAHPTVETIHGKVFNTSTLRMLQLYPAQAGRLMIDEMQLQNEIEFDDSLIRGHKIKKEKILISNPVAIEVKELPGDKPSDFTGAVGKFKIETSLADSTIMAGQPGKLLIRIRGKGNFIQFSPPLLQWPAIFDVFEPQVSDQLKKDQVPSEGVREYLIVFSSDSAGSFILPPVEFGYFDPVSNSWQSLKTDSLNIHILPAALTENKKITEPLIRQKNKSWIISLLIPGIFIAALFVFFRKRKPVEMPVRETAEDGFAIRLKRINAEEPDALMAIAALSKLLGELKKSKILSKPGHLAELQEIQTECQLMVYSDIGGEEQREKLFSRTEKLLNQI